MLINNRIIDFTQIDIDELYEKLHDDYVFIVKWHPALYNNIIRGVVEAPDFNKYPDFFIDLSHYRDINDLLIVCDVLITDYSSLIFDYLLLDKPIIYFAHDLEEYTQTGGRGLYFDFDDYVYGKVAFNQSEMIEAIHNTDLMEDKRKIFYHKFMNECDGHSTEKTCQWVFDIH